MIYVDCNCGQELKTADHAAGTIRKCPACGEKMEFPKLERARKTALTTTTVLALSPQSSVRASVAQLPAVEYANEAASTVTADLSVDTVAVEEQAAPEELNRHSLPIEPNNTGKCYFSLVSQYGSSQSAYPNISLQGDGVHVKDAIPRRIVLILDEERQKIRLCCVASIQNMPLGPSDVEVSCVVTDFNFGSRTMRYFLTPLTIFGPGACRLGIQGHIRDAKYGVRAFEINRKLGAGFFGGSSESMMKLNITRAADKIACKVARQLTGKWLLNHNVYTLARSSFMIGLFTPVLFIFPPLALVGLILGLWSMMVIALRKLPKRKYMAAAGIVLNLIGVGISVAFFMNLNMR